MSDYLFGFELETVSPLNKGSLALLLCEKGIPSVEASAILHSQRDDYLYQGKMSLVNDGSISPKQGNGVEIRSYVFRLSELDKFKPFFVALKELGVMTNVRCGLHIHVSHPSREIDAVRLVEVSKKEDVRVRRNRRIYCSWRRPIDPHYWACNQRTRNHVEFRWFNAAIDFRYLCRMVRLVNVYCRSLEAVESNVDESFLSVPGEPAYA